MKLVEPLVMELEQEGEVTRRVLERVPEEKLSWRPHANSRNLGQLAVHIAGAQKTVTAALQKPTYEMSPEEPAIPSTTAEIVALFDTNLAETKALLSDMSDEDLMSEWSLTAGGNPVFTAPKVAVVRGVVLNHIVHHRGQLTVYLRQLDVKVPSIYGPSFDENPFMPA
ncbi:MAG: DinB family protein [Acidobacteriota bacterium]